MATNGYVRSFNPVWSFVDLTGKQCDDTFYLFTLENDLPYIPSPVWHDPNGQFPWTDPIQFLANGTLPIDIYWNPAQVYRLEIRQGNTQSAPLIYEINNYIPDGGGGNTPIDAVGIFTDNQITNPQFSLISFNSPFALANTTIPDGVEVAPGWFLEADGTGTVILAREALNSSQANATNAPYALKMTLSGTWTAGTVRLRQRFNQNGMLWANKYVSTSITAKIQGAATSIQVYLVDSMGTPLTSLLNIPALTEEYEQYQGYALIPATTNTDTPPDAYIDYQIRLPSNIEIYLTSIQVIASDIPTDFEYEQDTIERQVDHTFHYYRDSILFSPKASVLTGWNFGLNPWQFTTTADTALATFGYTADQTIAVTQPYVSSATGNAILVGRGTADENYGFKVTANAASNQFALIQYIDAATIRPYCGSSMSALVTLNAQKQTPSSTLFFKLRLIYRATVPSTLSQSEPIASWTASNNPNFSAGWFVAAPENDPVYNLANGVQTLAFNNMSLPASLGDNMTVGIVAFTISNMVSTGTPDNIVFNDISLVPNEFAIASNPLTFDQTLSQCQYYYETSLNIGQLPDQNLGFSNVPILKLQTVQTVGLSHYLAVSPFNLEFLTIKRTASPTVTLYHPNGTINQVEANLYYNGTSASNVTAPTSYWAALSTTNKAIAYVPSGTASVLTANALVAQAGTGYIQFYYTIDGRLGLVA
jgi:hypothetical protein